MEHLQTPSEIRRAWPPHHPTSPPRRLHPSESAKKLFLSLQAPKGCYSTICRADFEIRVTAEKDGTSEENAQETKPTKRKYI